MTYPMGRSIGARTERPFHMNDPQSSSCDSHPSDTAMIEEGMKIELTFRDLTCVWRIGHSLLFPPSDIANTQLNHVLSPQTRKLRLFECIEHKCDNPTL